MYNYLIKSFYSYWDSNNINSLFKVPWYVEYILLFRILFYFRYATAVHAVQVNVIFICHSTNVVKKFKELFQGNLLAENTLLLVSIN